MRKLFKKTTALLMAATLTMGLMLTGCGSTEEAEEEVAEEVVEETTEAAEETEVEDADAEETGDDTAVDAGIYVAKVDLDDDFVTGVDISSYLSEISSGVTYYDYDGNALDEEGFFTFLGDCGVNCVRIRVWNDPYDSDGNGYGGGNNDLEAAITMGQYATAAGLGVMIDFHFSDFWADPSKQDAPKAWADMSATEVADAIYSYTTESVTALLDAGVNLTIVQIGNETNGAFCGSTDWDVMGTYFAAGCNAVRDVDSSIEIALHFANPETSNRYTDYASKLESYGVDYDIFASSYYPYWHGTIYNLKSVLAKIASGYGKKVMVAETSYVYTYEDGDGHSNTIGEGTAGADINYDVSIQGQANLMYDVVSTVASISGGCGVFYWEPAWIPVQVYDETADDAATVLAQNKSLWETYGSGWAASYATDYDPDDAGVWYGGSAVDNQAWFDFSGNAMEICSIFNYLRTGTNCPIVVTSVTDVELTAQAGTDIEMPETVYAVYTDGSKDSVEVAWDEDAVAAASAAGIGEYDITGSVEADGATYEVHCTLTLEAHNYITNNNFDDTEDSSWVVTSSPDGSASIDYDQSNARSGNYCLHFWMDSSFSFDAYQEVELEPGEYVLGTYVQGGDTGSGDVYSLYAEVNGQTLTADASLTGWLVWDNLEVTFTITETTTIKIGAKATGSSGAWGTWDDFYLNLVE